MQAEPSGATRRAFSCRLATALAVGLTAAPAARCLAAGPPLQVGPHRRIRTLAEASRLVTVGTAVEVDAGVYVGDVATWAVDGIRLRAVGGRVRLMAGGEAAEGKAIWVMRARDMQVEGFDFEGAAVPSRNGCGIRLESGSLRVRDCSFLRNEMGLLTNNDPQTELEVENSEFAYNQRPDGHNHGLYAGTIRRLLVTGCYFHHGHVGHLLKSRAALNRIAYNRLTDEAKGRASYELEFPNGGLAHVIGNIIQQGPLSQNPHLISYAAEGYRWPVNGIHLVHNTLVDDHIEPGVFLRVAAGDATVRIARNLLVGNARWDIGPKATLQANVHLQRDAFHTTGADAWRPRRAAASDLRALEADGVGGATSQPEREYRHPHGTVSLRASTPVAGALQPAP